MNEPENSQSDAVKSVVHTPGPWSAPTDIARGQKRCMVLSSRGDEIARLNHHREEFEADARLIAAAPDMYRLIRKCYKVLHMGVWEVDETDQEVCEQINDAMWNHFGDAWRPKADECV